MDTMWRWGLFLLLLSACSTLPPGAPPPDYQNPEQYFGLRSKSESGLPVLKVPAISALEPRWRPLSAGEELSVMAGKIQNPRLEFWALKIELDHTAEGRSARGGGGENLRLRIFLGAGESPRPGYVLSTRVSSFVRNNGLLAGINTIPFDPSSAREGEERRLAGIAISGGKTLAPPVSRYDALVFYAEGGAAIVNQGELDTERAKERIVHAVGGFHRILQDGELTGRALQKAAGPRHARSAAGLSAGGRTLYLMVVNGGSPGRRGATEAETALILKQLGARDVLNLDGGG
ncbi:MAG: phosphodiester glycosidase family protein, partial [Treponema sp.]|nr:phosphodiester glycosidase family protein [Treponema sp.]